MQTGLSADDLAERWTLDAGNWELLANKTGATRLGFAALLKFFEAEGRFPRKPEEVPTEAIPFLAQQVHVPAEVWDQYRWTGRTLEYHRAQIRAALGFREGGVEDLGALRDWLLEHLLSHERNMERLKEAVAARCRKLRIEPFAPDRIDRLIRSAVAAFEEEFCRRLSETLPPATQQGLDALLLTEQPESGRVALHQLRADPGSASIETLEEELVKLENLWELALPTHLFDGLAPEIVQSYRRRAAVEEIHELRRHPAPVRFTLLAAFCHLRMGELIDTLCDLLVDMIHKVAHRAEVKVERELVADFKRVSGKNGLLFQIAEASMSSRTGTAPTTSSSSARAARWPLTAPMTRRSACLRCISCNSPLSTSTP